MGFTGSLVLARTALPLCDLAPLAAHDTELVSRNAEHWQLLAVPAGVPDVPGCLNTLVEATAAPVLIAAVDDSDTALLFADSPRGHRWITVLNAPPDSAGRAAVADTRAMSAIADTAVAWATEAGCTSTTDTVLEALRVADRDHDAADRAWLRAAYDAAALRRVLRTQIPFIEVYVLRVLDTLGIDLPARDDESWWAHLANLARTPSPTPHP